MVHEAMVVFAIRGMSQTSGMGTRGASSRWAQEYRCSRYLLVVHVFAILLTTHFFSRVREQALDLLDICFVCLFGVPLMDVFIRELVSSVSVLLSAPTT